MRSCLLFSLNRIEDSFASSTLSFCCLICRFVRGTQRWGLYSFMRRTCWGNWLALWTFCRWCFDVELVFLCKWFGIPMIEISVNWSEIPGSKVNPLSIPNMLWELALMSVGYRTRMWTICTWVSEFIWKSIVVFLASLDLVQYQRKKSDTPD
jgi:hypothetical protein